LALFDRKPKRGNYGVKSDPAKRDNRFYTVHQFCLAEQEWATIQNLIGQGLVLGRRAVYYGRDVAIYQRQSVIAMNRSRLICKSSLVKRAVEPIAAAVSGKYSPCPVSSVRRGRKAYYKQARTRVAKARHRPAPVIIRGEAAHLLASNLLSPLDQSRAAPATNHPPLELCHSGRIIDDACPILHLLEF
jgi:hypothetical protein